MKHLLPFIALFSLSGLLPAQVVINEVSAANINGILDEDNDREDWVELHNSGASAVNLAGWFLSDNPGKPQKWTFPAGATIAAGGFRLVFCSGKDKTTPNFHSNFKITQTKGESVILTQLGGATVDLFTFSIPNQGGHSYGRAPNGGPNWKIFTAPTPNAANGATAFSQYAPAVQASPDAGFFAGSVSVSLSTDPGLTIRFTTNGSEPTAASTLYSTPLNIAATTVLKAAAFSPNPQVLPGFVTANTYFINENHSIPVISVASNTIATLMGGSSIRPFGSFEYFENGLLETEAYGEFNKHGNDSWAYPQRGIDWITRDQLGYEDDVKHQFFPERTRKKFQRLILKAAANDNYPSASGAHIRDSYVHTLAIRGGLNVDGRTHRSCILYVNGQYWGIYDLREKVDDHDFTDFYFKQAEKDIDFIKTWGSTWEEYGSWTDWYTLKNFILANNMASAANYAWVGQRLDFLSLIDYIILNQHTVCKDWLNWNTAWWRGRNPNGGAQKWRYALWDMDATFGHYINYTGIPNTGPTADPCDVEQIPPSGDPQGHVDILMALFQNPDFKALYTNRYADLLNTALSCPQMHALLDSLTNEISPEMARHCSKWGGTVNGWKNNVQVVHNFIDAHCQVIDDGIVDCYDVTGPFDLTVKISPVSSPNQVQVNTITPTVYPFSGEYFGAVNIGLTAKPAIDWTFDHWEVMGNPFGPNQLAAAISMALANDAMVTAFFLPIDPCANPAALSFTHFLEKSCDPTMVGIDTTFFKNKLGCDSLVIKTTSLAAKSTSFLSAQTCNPQAVGLDTLILQNSLGCDSLVITTTVFDAAGIDFTLLFEKNCDPQAVGTDTSFLKNGFGCDSLVIKTTSLSPKSTAFLAGQTCNPAAVGIDTMVLQNSLGCDSLVITTTVFDAAGIDFTLLSETHCDPQAVGIDTAFLKNSFGCDSLVIKTTSLAPKSTSFLSAQTCNPQAVGLDTLVLQNSQGCDSLVITTTVFDAAGIDFTLLFEKNCDPQAVGIDTSFLKNGFGCDSLVIKTTSLAAKSTSFLAAKTCNPQAVGSDTTVLKNSLGCDSLVITMTSFDAAGIDFTFLSEKNCDPAAVGIDTSFLKNGFGCDSLVIKTTSLAAKSTSFLVAQTCNPQAVGLDTTVLQNSLGCDSLVITTTVFDAAGIEFTFLSEKNCDPQAVGIDTSFLKNSFGCDSLVIKTTSLAPKSTSFLSAQTCNPAAVGLDTLVLKNSQGCDSLVITTTVFDAAGIDFTLLFEKNCDPQAVGIDTAFLKNSFGCDSLVIKTTSLAPKSTSFLSAQTCNPAAVGIDTLVLKNSLGCDSLVITTTVFDAAGIDFTLLFEKNCDPQAVGIDTAFLKNSFGCDSLVIKTTEYAGLELQVSATEQVCFHQKNGQIQLDSIFAGPFSGPINVSLGGNPPEIWTGQPLFLENLAAGFYTISATNSAGCTVSTEIEIGESDSLTLDLGLSEISLFLGDSILLEPAANFQIAAAEWLPAEGLSCPVCATTFLLAERGGLFTLRASDPFGCSAVAAVRLRVEREIRVFVPSVLRPGSGGPNGQLTVFAGPEVREVRLLRLFDRWGTLIFQQKNLSPNVPSDWDGTNRGRLLAPGVYVWFCEIETERGERVNLKGDLTVVR